MEINETLSEARSLWNKGNALEAGKLVFETLPLGARPQWAARVLRLIVDWTGIRSPPLELAIRIANTPNDWIKAHEVFSTLRRATLELERLGAPSPAQALLLKHLLLAELVAKVTYNSTNPVDAFDDDSGWWIAPCLKDILYPLDDAQLSATVWSALFGMSEAMSRVGDSDPKCGCCRAEVNQWIRCQSDEFVAPNQWTTLAFNDVYWLCRRFGAAQPPLSLGKRASSVLRQPVSPCR